MSSPGRPEGHCWWRTLAVVVSVGLYTVLAPCGYAAFALLAALPGRQRRARWIQWVVQRAFAFMHHWLRWFSIVNFDPRSVRPHVPAGPLVVVANHPTLTDTTAVIGAIPSLCTAVRPDLYDKLWLHPLLASAGHFSAGARTLLGSKRLLSGALACLERGFRVLIFPEGSRSPRGGLRPFGRSAFEVSCQARVPVFALCIAEHPAWLAPGDRLFGPPAKLPHKTLSVLGCFRPEDFSFDSRRMRAYVESRYRQELGLEEEIAASQRMDEPQAVEAS